MYMQEEGVVEYCIMADNHQVQKNFKKEIIQNHGAWGRGRGKEEGGGFQGAFSISRMCVFRSMSE